METYSTAMEFKPLIASGGNYIDYSYNWPVVCFEDIPRPECVCHWV